MIHPIPSGTRDVLPDEMRELGAINDSMRAVFAGMIAGVATAAFLMLSHRDPVFGLSAGFLALCLNFLIVVAVSLSVPVAATDRQLPDGTADLPAGG